MNGKLSALFFAAALVLPQAALAAQQLNLTVYNGGTALVHDRREIALRQGANTIAWRGVSAQMDPRTALLEPVGAPGSVHVLEQNFDFDVLNPQALMQSYVGRDVVVVHEPRFDGERETHETARILSVDNGIVLQYRDRIETGVNGRIVYPFLPTNFQERPTLELDLSSVSSGEHLLDLSYITSGLSWSADYVGVLSPDEKRLALTGLVTLSNTSGVSYENARLQLVAGNVNIAQIAGQERGQLVAGTTSDVYSANAATQESYFEYHLYTFRRPASILDKQTKQLTLLSAHNVPVRKTLELRGDGEYYRTFAPDLGDRLPVGVYVSFENRGGDLGIPLPAGTVRIYANDSHGLSQFLGSDGIDHTPANETVRLHMGDSFDVTARKKQTEFHLTGACRTQSSYQVALANAKSAPADVLVVEPIPGDWRITAENLPHRKSSASTATWTVAVPADGKTTLTYTAEVEWCSLRR